MDNTTYLNKTTLLYWEIIAYAAWKKVWCNHGPSTVGVYLIDMKVQRMKRNRAGQSALFTIIIFCQSSISNGSEIKCILGHIYFEKPLVDDKR